MGKLGNLIGPLVNELLELADYHRLAANAEDFESAGPLTWDGQLWYVVPRTWVLDV